MTKQNSLLIGSAPPKMKLNDDRKIPIGRHTSNQNLAVKCGTLQSTSQAQLKTTISGSPRLELGQCTDQTPLILQEGSSEVKSVNAVGRH
jgi:hypothetical protein